MHFDNLWDERRRHSAGKWFHEIAENVRKKVWSLKVGSFLCKTGMCYNSPGLLKCQSVFNFCGTPYLLLPSASHYLHNPATNIIAQIDTLFTKLQHRASLDSFCLFWLHQILRINLGQISWYRKWLIVLPLDLSYEWKNSILIMYLGLWIV